MSYYTFGERLKFCLKDKQIKQSELAKLTNITPSSISDWLKNKYLPKQDKLLKISECLDVNPEWLSGKSDIYENYFDNDIDEEILENILKVPILGTICAGDGVYCEENFEDYLFVDRGMNADFALRVSGDSMEEAGIYDGDIVFIKKKNYVENGKIAAVRLTEWNEAALKKFYRTKNNVILQPCNSNYDPIITRNVEVIGECVGLYREM